MYFKFMDSLIVIINFVYKVSDVEAEYFPPKEDVILQNEAQTDLYVLVSGSVVSRKLN